MVLAQSLALHLLITLRTISASPLPRHHKPTKRSTTSQNVDSGFVIAICIVFLAVISYYLGMHHKRTKSWFSRRNAPTVPEPVTDNKTIMEEQRHERQISCPLAVSSSAPIKPYDDPVEAPTPSLRYYELPIKEVHEMGLPSPKKPSPRASWLSLDHKPWWLKYPEDESRSKSVRSWFKSERSMNVQEEIPKPSPGLIEAVHLEAHNASEDEKERTSDGSTFMDWSGLDYVRRVYIGRKSWVGI